MVEIEVSPGVFKRAADLPSQMSFKTVTDANYDILDDDGYDIIFVSTGEGEDRTITLPTAEDNSGRKIRVMKIDDASKTVIIDGKDSEKIVVDGTDCDNQILSKKSEEINIICDGSKWWKINASGDSLSALAFL